MYGKKVKLRFYFYFNISFSNFISFFNFTIIRRKCCLFSITSEIKNLIEIDKKKIRVGGMVKEQSFL